MCELCRRRGHTAPPAVLPPAVRSLRRSLPAFSSSPEQITGRHSAAQRSRAAQFGPEPLVCGRQAAAAVMPVDAVGFRRRDSDLPPRRDGAQWTTSPRSIAHRGGTANDAAFGPFESPGCRLRMYVQNAGMNTGCLRRKFCDQGGPGGGDPLFGGSMPSASSFIQNAGVNTEYL